MKLTESDYISLGVKNSKQFIDPYNEYLTLFKINTVNRLIAFFMNVLHESWNFRYTEEIADGSEYESRKDLGNTIKGDGIKYKGRGHGMVTGRYNYGEFTKWCKINKLTDIDFVKNPERLSETKWAVLSSFWFWERHNLESYADKGKFIEVSSIWNTGKIGGIKINGLEDRLNKKEKIQKWIIKLLNQ